MEKVLIRYEGNGSSRNDGKEYFVVASKLKRENSRGPLKNGKQVTSHTSTGRVCRSLGGEKLFHASILLDSSPNYLL